MHIITIIDFTEKPKKSNLKNSPVMNKGKEKFNDIKIKPILVIINNS